MREQFLLLPYCYSKKKAEHKPTWEHATHTAHSHSNTHIQFTVSFLCPVCSSCSCKCNFDVRHMCAKWENLISHKMLKLHIISTVDVMYLCLIDSVCTYNIIRDGSSDFMISVWIFFPCLLYSQIRWKILILELALVGCWSGCNFAIFILHFFFS